MIEPDTSFTSFLFADGVSLVIELKDSLSYLPDFEKSAEVLSLFKQVTKTKQLRRKECVLSLPHIGITRSPQQIEYSKTLPFYVFARTVGDVDALADYMIKWMIENGFPVLHWPDLIIGLDGKGIYVPKYPERQRSVDGKFVENEFFTCESWDLI